MNQDLKELLFVVVSAVVSSLVTAWLSHNDIFKIFKKEKHDSVVLITTTTQRKHSKFLFWYYRNAKYMFAVTLLLYSFYFVGKIAHMAGISSIRYLDVLEAFISPGLLIFYLLFVVSRMYYNDFNSK